MAHQSLLPLEAYPPDELASLEQAIANAYSLVDGNTESTGDIKGLGGVGAVALSIASNAETEENPYLFVPEIEDKSYYLIELRNALIEINNAIDAKYFYLSELGFEALHNKADTKYSWNNSDQHVLDEAERIAIVNINEARQYITKNASSVHSETEMQAALVEILLNMALKIAANSMASAVILVKKHASTAESVQDMLNILNHKAFKEVYIMKKIVTAKKYITANASSDEAENELRRALDYKVFNAAEKIAYRSKANAATFVEKHSSTPLIASKIKQVLELE